MAVWRARLARFSQVWAYAQVGVVNAAFGYGVFALLILVGINLFAAQIISHLLGMAFNYVMFRRHVFKDSKSAVGRYILAYAVNYGIGLVILMGLNQVIASDYLAGFLTIALVAVINFLVLKFLVFLPRTTTR